LLELGAGFHPDLTGSENIYLYGAIMGLSRAQMRDRFDAIVRFAGIEHYIDQPVKHYSSGMYVRLGFAVAVEVNPDILLIDEVLAVGDSEFQRKCIEKMQDFRDHGKTMLIISHDLRTIQSISDRIVVLQEGKIVGIGLPDNMVRAYQSIARRGETSGIAREWGTGDARITGVRFMDDSGKETAEFEWGATLCAEIAYETSKRIDNPVFGFSMGDMRGRTVFGNNTQIEGIVIPMIEGTGKISLRLKKLNMAAGTYLFSFSLHSSDHRINYHRLDNQFPVAVSCNKSFEGCCYMDTTWTVK
ncbi:MAG: ABC transporter ATP-binding protein, partial [Lentisphaerae bacterium]|nr:ABC transporter ATP-binding protein [Lentisphaerota bacterium]